MQLCRAIGAVLLIAACGRPAPRAVDGGARTAERDPRINRAARPLAIRGATILTAAGRRHDRGTIVLDRGAITYVGDDPARVPPEAVVIDGDGRTVTPGLIDAHSHLGVYASPGGPAHEDGNEASAPITAAARAEYGYWPQDPGIPRARAGGVTTALILPGSANLIGGRGVAVVMRPGRTVEEVRFPSAPPAVKLACGENPKRVHGEKGGPMTRMAEYAAFRAAFGQAREYKQKRARARARPGEIVPQDLGLETLGLVLDGKALVHVHCYRADDLAQMMAIADEAGFEIRVFHHALEAYKLRDAIARAGIAVATWADWWGGKLEMLDGIPENAALFAEAGGRPIIHSDSAIGIQRLNQEAAKAMYAGRAAGIAVDEDEALRWITANPAWAIGIDSAVGTLEAGKRADVVVWSGSPFSVYSRAEIVIQAGEVTYRASEGAAPTDFELENSARGAR